MDNEMNSPHTQPGDANPGGMRNEAASSGRSVRKGLAIGLTAGVLGGAAAGFAFGVPGLSSAASPSVVQQTEDSVPSSDSATESTPAADPVAPASDELAGTRLRDAIQPLVDAGTITAAQADAVVAQLEDSFPGRGAGHRGGPMGGDHRGGHGGGGFGRFFGEASDALTELLGIDAATLREELESGSTLAEVATAHGVDTQVVIDTLVTAAAAQIDQAVTDGRIDADKADEIKATLEERVTDRVNGVRPDRPADDEVTTED
jgi:hypothetical protein